MALNDAERNVISNYYGYLDNVREIKALSPAFKYAVIRKVGDVDSNEAFDSLLYQFEKLMQMYNKAEKKYMEIGSTNNRRAYNITPNTDDDIAQLITAYNYLCEAEFCLASQSVRHCWHDMDCHDVFVKAKRLATDAIECLDGALKGLGMTYAKKAKENEG